MDAGLGGRSLMRDRDIKLKHELSIAMSLYEAHQNLVSPWFSSPEFSARGLLVRCTFDEWKTSYAISYRHRMFINIETIYDKDLSLLNKVSGKYLKSKILEDFVTGSATVQFAVPDTDFETHSRTGFYYADFRKLFSTPATAKIYLPGDTLGQKDAVSQWAKEGKQLVLTIEVTLKLLEVSSYPSLSLPIVACSTQSSTNETLQRMLSEALLPDVQLLLQDGVLPAHRAVLAACSPVFRAMFAHDMKESQSGQVDMPDVPLAAMEASLRFLYGGELSSQDPDLWVQLLELAERYQLASLKALCEATLCARVPELPSELLLRLLVLADQHNTPDLRRVTLSHLSACLRAKKLGRDALDLVKNYPSVAKDLIEFLVQ